MTNEVIQNEDLVNDEVRDETTLDENVCDSSTGFTVKDGLLVTGVAAAGYAIGKLGEVAINKIKTSKFIANIKQKIADRKNQRNENSQKPSNDDQKNNETKSEVTK